MKNLSPSSFYHHQYHCITTSTIILIVTSSPPPLPLLRYLSTFIITTIIISRPPQPPHLTSFPHHTHLHPLTSTYYFTHLHLHTSQLHSPPPPAPHPLTSLTQAALVALETVSESWMEERIVELKEKRDLALALVREIPGVQCPTPMGAFYIMPKVSADN